MKKAVGTWKRVAVTVAATGAVIAAANAFGQAPAAPAPKIDSGDTAWVLASAALVLLMTPGLAFFYGGMVRTRNVVSTLFQNFAALAVIGLIWGLVGYSMSFGPTMSGFVGNFDWAMLRGVGQEPNADYSATIPHLAFMLFQAMFAIITPALITGAVAERLTFKAWIGVMTLWSLVVYSPVCHWVWAVGGWAHAKGVLDFAGGLVVHMTAGFSALTAALVLRRRKDFGKPSVRPYDTGYVMLGTGLLWFGWFGFNAGSALSANGLAATAFANTFFATCAAGVMWAVIDTFRKGKASAAGACIGAVVGLVAITPACGFVPVWSSVILGALAATISNFGASLVRERMGIDDSLDVFACHGLGGLTGILFTGVFASKAVNSAGGDGLFFGSSSVFMANATAAGAVIVYSMVGTFVILKVVSMLTTLQVSEKEEDEGLDSTQHGELINDMAHGSNSGTGDKARRAS